MHYLVKIQSTLDKLELYTNYRMSLMFLFLLSAATSFLSSLIFLLFIPEMSISFNFYTVNIISIYFAMSCNHRNLAVYFALIISTFFKPWLTLFQFLLALIPCDCNFYILSYTFQSLTTVHKSQEKERPYHQVISSSSRHYCTSFSIHSINHKNQINM